MSYESKQIDDQNRFDIRDHISLITTVTGLCAIVGIVGAGVLEKALHLNSSNAHIKGALFGAGIGVLGYASVCIYNYVKNR